ncbi:MAG: anaerobic carbon-monoxide dehydrogenase catalytic subunit [Dehalococcoidia bacterium]|nr:anaerobic carbon-monoxide dehydrogenase catalytic subunit [Dehalococcoidia bacterium]
MAETRKTIDPAVVELLQVAKSKGISTPFDRAEVTKPCPIGRDGSCCRQCFMGPCRLVGKTLVGICGATQETVQARNMARMIAAGAASHNDHSRNMVFALLAAGEGKAPGFEIKDEKKLHKVAGYFGIKADGKGKEELAVEVAKAALAEFSTRESGELAYLKRATPKRQALWRKLGMAPRGIDREVVETLHRTHMGTDQDAEHLLDQALRCALSDGWGGSMIATDISDILFGTPGPTAAAGNYGVLKDDEVNIVIHGHEPTLAEMMVVAVVEKEALELARAKGAKGINLVGMCCSGNELLMRHGVPIMGNFLQQELGIATGAIEAMVVDYQCIMQGIQAAAEHTHTKIITVSPKAQITGALAMDFEDSNALEIARKIVRLAIDNYPNRKDVHIPDIMDRVVVGFSHEYIAYMQGGVYRESFRPLNDAIMQGRIRGAAGVVGCNNAQVVHDEAITNVIKELIHNDVLVVTTGCNAVTCAKQGLLTPEVMDYAGPGLREVCAAIGIPPVLHMGSCVDNTRILTVLTQMATEGGLGEDIDDLPAVGIAPEWMSEKALCIGAYFVASGVYTIFGVGSPVANSPAVAKMMTEGWMAKVGGGLEFEPDWRRMVAKALAHIDAKRKALRLEEYDPQRYALKANYVPGDSLPFEEYAKGSYSLSKK